MQPLTSCVVQVFGSGPITQAHEILCEAAGKVFQWPCHSPIASYVPQKAQEAELVLHCELPPHRGEQGTIGEPWRSSLCNTDLER